MRSRTANRPRAPPVSMNCAVAATRSANAAARPASNARDCRQTVCNPQHCHLMDLHGNHCSIFRAYPGLEASALECAAVKAKLTNGTKEGHALEAYFQPTRQAPL